MKHGLAGQEAEVRGKESGGAEPSVTALELAHATYRYDGSETAVERVDLTVERGDFLAIVGPNGSGKTTLLKLALGLLKPSAGEVRLFGQPVDEFRAWGRIGYVPQVAAGPHGRLPMTVGEVVAHGRYRGPAPLAFWRRGVDEAVHEALQIVGVEHLTKRRIGTLSIGQQQRVLVARALARNPDLLALDEPASGIDAHGEEQLFSVLRRLNQERGMTVMLVSHDIGTVMREATMVACINRSLVFHGPPHRLSRRDLAKLYGFPVDVLLHDLREHA